MNRGRASPEQMDLERRVLRAMEEYLKMLIENRRLLAAYVSLFK